MDAAPLYGAPHQYRSDRAVDQRDREERFSMPTSGSRTNPATSEPSAAPMVLTSVRTPAVRFPSERGAQRGADQREEHAGDERYRQHQWQADAKDRGRPRNRRQAERRDDRRERGIGDDGRDTGDKGERRRETVCVANKSQPDRCRKTAKCDAGQHDAEHHGERVGVPLDEQQQEAEPESPRGPGGRSQRGRRRREGGKGGKGRGRLRVSRPSRRSRLSSPRRAAPQRQQRRDSARRPRARCLARRARRRGYISPATTPVIAPSVFHPYRAPSTRPNERSSRISARVSSGSVMPMAVDGIRSRRNATSSRSGLSAHG